MKHRPIRLCAASVGSRWAHAGYQETEVPRRPRCDFAGRVDRFLYTSRDGGEEHEDDEAGGDREGWRWLGQNGGMRNAVGSETERTQHRPDACSGELTPRPSIANDEAPVALGSLTTGAQFGTQSIIRFG